MMGHGKSLINPLAEVTDCPAMSFCNSELRRILLGKYPDELLLGSLVLIKLVTLPSLLALYTH